MDLLSKLQWKAGLSKQQAEDLMAMLSPMRQSLLFNKNEQQFLEEVNELLEDVLSDEPEISINNGDTLDLIEIKEPNYNITPQATPVSLDETQKTPDHHQELDILPPKSRTYTQGVIPKKEEKESLFIPRLIGYTALLMALFIVFHNIRPQLSPKDTPDTTKDTETKILVIKKKSVSPAKPIKQEKPPKMPALRDQWTFSPMDNFKGILCADDGRLKKMSNYTIELWLKVSDDLAGETQIIEFIENHEAFAKLYINKQGKLCFSPNNNSSLLFPIQQKKMVHIAITHEKNSYNMYINGKAYGSLNLKHSNRTASSLRLLANKSNCKSLEVDEFRLTPQVIYTNDFKPNRILKLTEGPFLYIPFEKIISGKVSCFSSKGFQSFSQENGKWQPTKKK